MTNLERCIALFARLDQLEAELAQHKTELDYLPALGGEIEALRKEHAQLGEAVREATRNARSLMRDRSRRIGERP